jgi:septum formation inhibitor MinC
MAMKPVQSKLVLRVVYTMAEDENVAGELHGHFDQALRTALSGGLQITEQRARRRQHDAEAERHLAQDVAAQLAVRKRAEATALLVQQRLAAEEAERTEQSRRAVEEGTQRNQTAGADTTQRAPTAYPCTIGETLARSGQNASARDGAQANEHPAKARHQRERGAVRTTAELGR